VGSALVEAIRGSLDADLKATERTVQAVSDVVADIAAGVRRVAKSAA
jgi:tryptophan synthase alpha chain